MYSVAKKFPEVENLTTSDLEKRIELKNQDKDLLIVDSRRQVYCVVLGTYSNTKIFRTVFCVAGAICRY